MPSMKMKVQDQKNEIQRVTLSYSGSMKVSL